MDKSKVALVPCESYDEEAVYDALKSGIDLLGGLNAILKPEEKILLKPNLLKKAEPEQATTTHPTVFHAMGKLLQDSGFQNLSYGDSPGHGSMARVAEGAGIEKAALDLNIQPADFSCGTPVEYPDGHTAKRFELAPGVVESDAIINLCKMKTHALERITGGVKNLYGCVYGLNKSAGHAKYPDADQFGKMLADLACLLRPRLTVMDGIVAMEGNGPASGNPVSMKVLLISTDPVAVDSVFCRLIGLDPEQIPTNVYGQEYGAGTWENIEILTPKGVIPGEDILSLYGKEDFDVYRGPIEKGGFSKFDWFFQRIRNRPVIDKGKCVRCGICVESCPLEPKALTMGREYPEYHYDSCIRCFCCQEMCPKRAIKVKTPWLVSVVGKNW